MLAQLLVRQPDEHKPFYTGMYEGLDRLDPAVDKTSGGTVTKIAVYYPVSGAMRINGTLYFILKDHLGSSSVVTDASGTIAGKIVSIPMARRASRPAV